MDGLRPVVIVGAYAHGLISGFTYAQTFGQAPSIESHFRPLYERQQDADPMAGRNTLKKMCLNGRSPMQKVFLTSTLLALSANGNGAIIRKLAVTTGEMHFNLAFYPQDQQTN